MRTLLCVTLVIAACAREGARAPQTPAQQLVGTWEGRSYRSATDTGIPWRSELTVGADGAPAGSLRFAALDTVAVAMRTLELTDSTVTWELGPYYSPTAGIEVITRTEGRVSGDSLWGTFVALPTKGGATPGLSTAEWKNLEMQPIKGGEPIRGTFAAKRKSPAS